jgi:hypothetical protein
MTSGEPTYRVVSATSVRLLSLMAMRAKQAPLLASHKPNDAAKRNILFFKKNPNKRFLLVNSIKVKLSI